MKRKIGPGVYVVDEIGTINMDQWVVDDRKSKGLSVPESRPTPAAPDTANACPACRGKCYISYPNYPIETCLHCGGNGQAKKLAVQVS